ncbi:MAG: type II secretion system protein, partial [Acidimicrobiia bacterium]
MRPLERRSEDGFTLPELLVAITILGIIIVAIGAMITTSFRTTTLVSAELQGSRGPKVVSRYWIPDAEQAKTVDTSAPCGTGTTVVATFHSDIAPSAFTSPTDIGDGGPRTITWWEVAGPRDQLVRRVCDGSGAPKSLTVVSDLKGPPTLDVTVAGHYTISVAVP